MNRTRKRLGPLHRNTRHDSHEYPPDDGYSNFTWSRNIVCVPCRWSVRYAGGFCRHPRARRPEACPKCRAPLMVMPFTFSTPRKQDKWWTSLQTRMLWKRHLAYYQVQEQQDPVYTSCL